MDKVAVLMNKNAGKGQLADSQQAIAKVLESRFAEVVFYDMAQFSDRTKAILQILKQFDLVIIAGGDGTVHEVVNIVAPLPHRPTLAIIPAGTANDFSRQINMPQDPIEAAQTILALKKQSVDIGKTEQRYFVNFWGIGLITQASQSIDARSKQNIGKLAYYLQAIQSVGQVTPFKLTLQTQDKVIEDQAVMVIIGNGSYTGGVRALLPKANISDGLFEVLVIKEASIQTVLSILQSRKASVDHQELEGVIALQTHCLSISTEPSQTIDCDGESDGQTPTEIVVLPKHIEMIVGE
ncbi:diacylglycerol/lipid kinase family protein [Amphibacillus jilinensis]|uniref:diacylglycerol/lipid kinase family protein n=1 Tax=Amphibacillus jilinensis TaxID=1216008 RepID=UPI0002FFBD59|nr:diacylglycerol kinase family protein [Amphibacillus jilinensis]